MIFLTTPPHLSNTKAEVNFMAKQGMKKPEGKQSSAFPAIDNDLAVENLTNDFDMTAADLQDLGGGANGK